MSNLDEAFAEYGKLIAKPVKDGSSYGLIYVVARQDLIAVRNAAKTEEYLIEPFISGGEATCGVLEQSDGKMFTLPPIEIVAAEGRFDYTAKYLLKSTQEICPGRFTPEVTAQLQDLAVKAHRALSCSGYSRSDFIISPKGPIYLETNTLPGLTKASLYPKMLNARGHRLYRFPARSGRAGDQAHAKVVRAGRFGPAAPGFPKARQSCGKPLTARAKSARGPAGFTLCLPGRTKVNAGGAGVRSAGRGGMTETPFVPTPANTCGS